jgi:NTP pyrophosphatase (non-canonical NTP hydrolase)
MFERQFADVQQELAGALHKFPEWPTDPIHAAAIVAEECGELQRAVLQLTYEPHKTSRLEVMQEARQTAAMAIRFLASMNDYEFRKSDMVTQKQE